MATDSMVSSHELHEWLTFTSVDEHGEAEAPLVPTPMAAPPPPARSTSGCPPRLRRRRSSLDEDTCYGVENPKMLLAESSIGDSDHHMVSDASLVDPADDSFLSPDWSVHSREGVDRDAVLSTIRARRGQWPLALLASAETRSLGLDTCRHKVTPDIRRTVSEQPGMGLCSLPFQDEGYSTRGGPGHVGQYGRSLSLPAIAGRPLCRRDLHAPATPCPNGHGPANNGSPTSLLSALERSRRSQEFAGRVAAAARAGRGISAMRETTKSRGVLLQMLSGGVKPQGSRGVPHRRASAGDACEGQEPFPSYSHHFRHLSGRWRPAHNRRNNGGPDLEPNGSLDDQGEDAIRAELRRIERECQQRRPTC